MHRNTTRQKALVYRLFLKHLVGDREIQQISTMDIYHFITKLAKKNGNKTANRYLRDIKALFYWGIRKRIIRIDNPCDTIEKFPEEPFEKYIPPIEDILRVRMAADKDERGLIDCVYHLGARIGEIKRLTWEDINFEKRSVRLYTRKRRGGQLQADNMAMNNILYQALKERWEHRDKSTNKVFQFGEYQVRYMMERLCKRAGVPKFGFHSIRHHVISVINDIGKASMKQTQEFARHRRQSTTETYLHSISKDMHETVGILEDYWGRFRESSEVDFRRM